MQWSWKESNGLERTIYVPYFDRIGCIINKTMGKWSWKKSKIPSFCCVPAISSKNGWICRGFDLTDCLTVGHTLAMTHVYNSKYTSLRLLMVCKSVLYVSMVLCLILDSPEPWLNQLYAWRSCLAAPTLLGNDATCEHWKMAFLFSFSLTGLGLYCHGRSKFSAATMSHIQIILYTLGISMACW